MGKRKKVSDTRLGKFEDIAKETVSKRKKRKGSVVVDDRGARWKDDPATAIEMEALLSSKDPFAMGQSSAVDPYIAKKSSTNVRR